MFSCVFDLRLDSGRVVGHHGFESSDLQAEWEVGGPGQCVSQETGDSHQRGEGFWLLLSNTEFVLHMHIDDSPSFQPTLW